MGKGKLFEFIFILTSVEEKNQIKIENISLMEMKRGKNLNRNKNTTRALALLH